MPVPPKGVDRWSGFEGEALENRREAAFGNVVAPMARAGDLMLYKAIAGRPRDRDDLEALLTLHRVDLRHVRQRIVALAELAESPEMVQVFDAAALRALGHKTAR